MVLGIPRVGKEGGRAPTASSTGEEPQEVLQVQAAGLLLQDLPAGALQQDPQEPLQVPGWAQGQGGVDPHKEELSQVISKPLFLHI